MKQLIEERSIGAFVVENPLRAKIFEKYGIDYCCGGKRSLAEVCREREIDAKEIIAAIVECDSAADPQTISSVEARVGSMSMSDLSSHIENTHHALLHEELPRLNQLASKVAAVHGDRHPELKILAGIFSAFKQELDMHMMKEEQVLFPFIRELDKATSAPSFHCGSLANPIRVMEFEHDQAGDALRKMREITDNYRLPENACNSYRALFKGLEEMERDLHTHVHEENNILFPAAIKKENSFNR